MLVINREALLKTLSHSADIAGIASVSNAILEISLLGWSRHQLASWSGLQVFFVSFVAMQYCL